MYDIIYMGYNLSMQGIGTVAIDGRRFQKKE